jgi:hypothetical protein
MKHICKYKMHKDNNHRKITPYFISDGGYFIKGGEIIGITEDDDIIYVPKDTLITLTNDEFISYIKSLDLNDSQESKEGSLQEVALDSTQKEDLAKAWLKERFLLQEEINIK